MAGIKPVPFVKSFVLLIYLTVYHLIRNIVLLLMPISRRRKDVSKDVVLITGSGSGIGRLMALKFAKLGSTLVLWDINEEAIEETARIARDKTGAKVYTYVCDVSKPESVYKTAESVRLQVGNVTILINNAGVVSGNFIQDIPDDAIKRTMEINALSHFWMAKAFLPSMIKYKRGHIVEIDSVAGFMGGPLCTDYCASKFAVNAFAECLRAELRSLGNDFIHVTTICPYLINTGMFRGFDDKRSLSLKGLDPEFVAQRTVDAILTNEQLVLIPWHFKIILILKGLLPGQIMDQIQRLIGGENPMKNFIGRSAGTKSN